MDSKDKYLVDGKYSIQDLLDLDRLRSIFERFSEATGFTTGLVSYPNQELLIKTGWRDACVKFHRAFPISEVHCKQSNLELTSKLKARKELNIRRCESGLVDGATPIIIKGAHVANLFTGQIFLEEPDMDLFSEQGESYGYDVKAYIEALKKVPVVRKEELKKALSFLSELAVMMAEKGQADLETQVRTEAIKKSEERFRGLVESTSDWIWEVDNEGVYIYSSPQVESMLGYKPEEVVGKTPFFFMSPEEAERVAKIFEGCAMSGKAIVALENTLFHKDGHIVVFETSGVPIVDSEGNVSGYRGVDRNISERKHTEKALRDEKEFADTVLNSQKDTFFLMELSTGKAIRWNQAFNDISGYTNEEISEMKAPFSYYSDEDSKLIVPFIDDVIKNGFGTIELELLSKDGRKIPTEYNVATINEPNGQTQYIISIGRNITERKRAEEELRKSEFFLRETSRIARVGGWKLNPETDFLTWTEGVYDIIEAPLDYKPTLSEGIKYYLPKYVPILRKRLQRTFTHGDPFTEECEVLTGSGKRIWVEVRGVARMLEGKTVYVCGTFQDITERKKAEESFRTAQNYIANIIDSMPSILVGVDPKGVVTQWNIEAQRITGVSVQEAVGQALDKAFPRLGSKMNRVLEAMSTNKVLSYRRQEHELGDETKFEDITIYPLIAKGVEGAVIRIDDVSEQVRMEEIMIQGEKMLSVGGLAAGMAHEINNPLAGIIQSANVMANRLGENINMPANLKAAKAAGTDMEAIRKFMEIRGVPRMLDAINESGRRVATIVDNMLSFARKSDAKVSSIDFAELLDKTFDLAATDYDLKKHYDFKQIEIIKEYDSNMPFVPCERAKIQQVLLNILRNGAQAMQEAETIKPTFIVRTSLEKNRNMLCLEIENNGPKLDEQTSKRLFEPFYTTKPVGEGTGLGLSVSYFIITENHNGEMEVQSLPDSGVKFIIRLPVEEQKYD